MKNVQKFLWFVKDFARMAKPLHEITRKDIKWNWRERQQKVFEKLKEGFMMEPVLIIPELDKEIRVETNAPNFVIGGVLLIKYENKKWKFFFFLRSTIYYIGHDGRLCL